MNYKCRKFLLTIPERKLFNKLKKNLGKDYAIFPQICIRSLLSSDYDIDNRYKWAIVDYLICKKPYYEPILVIELDDSTHKLPDRQIRDKEVEKILKDIDLPIWRISNIDNFNQFDINLEFPINEMFKSYKFHSDIKYHLDFTSLFISLFCNRYFRKLLFLLLIGLLGLILNILKI